MESRWACLEGLMVTPLSMSLGFDFVYLLVNIQLAAAGGDDSRVILYARQRSFLYSRCPHRPNRYRVFLSFHLQHSQILLIFNILKFFSSQISLSFSHLLIWVDHGRLFGFW